MPHVINGIGTWYYGKKRVHRYKSTCAFCNRTGELESYDTTLYFVVLMVPLIPLRRKRVLEQCPACQKHRVVNLTEWEKQKDKALAAVLERQDDREMNAAALVLAISYQDEVLFDHLVGMFAADRSEDALMQAQIGSGYSYFARWPEAETAFRASLAVDDKPEVRRQLAWALLKQHRPEEAAPFLRHILDEKLKEEAGTIYVLIEAFQAEGMHREALELMDQRDAAFPDLVGLKAYKQQRKTSERYQNSGKKIKSAVLSESKRVGYQEGGWRANIPKLIGPLIVLGLLIWYLAAAIHMGKARQVFLVDGVDKPYTVKINGLEQTLQPGAPRSIQIPEGNITVEFINLPLEPVHCHIGTPFFTRPFQNRTFVINPDQLAVLFWQQTAYSAVPQPGQEQHHFLLGEVLHSFDGIDFVFQPFPASLPVKQGQTITKTRIDLVPKLDFETRRDLEGLNANPARQIEYAKQWLKWHPEDLLALYWLMEKLPQEQALEFLKPGLAVRPLWVEWHRAYQSQMEKAHPDLDLRAEYRRLLEELKGNPDAVYLLARLEDVDQGDRLFRQAAEGPNPSRFAIHALGHQALSEGQFTQAVTWMEKSSRMAPENPQVWQDFKLSLLASRQYDRLLQELEKQPKTGANHLANAADRIRALAGKGDKVAARAVIDEATRLSPGPEATPYVQMKRAFLEMTWCCQEKDAAGYLKWAAQFPEQTRFESALLKGDLEAASKVETEYYRTIGPALLYLAALKAGDQKRADQIWSQLMASLDKSDRYSRQLSAMLTGRQPVSLPVLRRLPMHALHKRVLLVVVAKRFPDLSKDLISLARQLDFYADATSLCLAKLMDKVDSERD